MGAGGGWKPREVLSGETQKAKLPKPKSRKAPALSQNQIQVKYCSAKGEAVSNLTSPGRMRSFCRTGAHFREGISVREVPEWYSPWFMGALFLFPSQSSSSVSWVHGEQVLLLIKIEVEEALST